MIRIFGNVIVNIKKRVHEAYGSKLDKEAAYATYRAITGAGIQESHRAVKPWIAEWEGKQNDNNK
jgi:hypothetical protein